MDYILMTTLLKCKWDQLWHTVSVCVYVKTSEGESFMRNKNRNPDNYIKIIVYRVYNSKFTIPSKSEGFIIKEVNF